MNPLISVVVPIYNVEKYLQRCIKSLQNQSYENIEIILVDDGSTDKSGVLCDDAAKRDVRIRVIHKNNGGLSDARNIGLSLAIGDFVLFVDSDDWIEKETIKTAYLKCISSNADVVIWGYYADFVSDDEQIISQTSYSLSGTCNRVTKEEVFSKNGAFGLFGYAWNKLYRKYIVENLKFKKGISLVEDILFNASVAEISERIEFIDYIGTHYIQRGRETLGTKYYSDYIELKSMVGKVMIDIMKKYAVPENKLRDIIFEFFNNTTKSAIRMIANDKVSYSEKKERMRLLIQDDKVQQIVRKVSPKGWKSKIIFRLIRIKAGTLLLMLS